MGILAVALPVMDYLRAVPGDLGDARFNSVVLEHLYLWTKGLEPGLWSPGFFYPYPGALTFSDNHFGSGALYVALRYLHLDREYAFDLWYLASYVLNYAACFHALRRFGYGAVASACGAFFFAFALPVSESSGHAQLGFRFAVPLALASFHDLVERREFRRLGHVAGWVALEFYCSIYVGFFLVFLLAAYIAATSVRWKLNGVRVRGFWTALISAYVGATRREVAITVACVALSALAIMALLYPYAHYSKLYGFQRSPEEVVTMLPRWGSYLLADWSWIWRGLSARVEDIPVRHEHQMFVGLGAVLLALAGVGYRHDRWGAASLIAIGLLVLVTMKFPHFSIYLKLIKLPGISSIRAVARIVLVMLFPISILVARGVERSIRVPRRRRLAVVVALAVLLMIVECVAFAPYHTPIKSWRDRLTLYQGELPDQLPSSAIVFVPVIKPDDTVFPEIDGVILAQDRGVMSLNGYSGNAPLSYRADFNDPCNEVWLRVSGYAVFAQLPEHERQALLERVIPIGLPICHSGRVE
ncbi:hypothetical protein [Pinirhizobacter soli]|uniref:hypothetical protein n=1 Tax=Pinirhizobacter soli TaxID=2786953 RepID=UPI00202A9956|nr:hypothetical protein [Pinirhizobacter soli]